MKTIQEMAREAGWDAHHAEFDTRIERYAALVREEEREACAKLCDEVHNRKGFMSDGNASECSDAIRARSNT